MRSLVLLAALGCAEPQLSAWTPEERAILESLSLQSGWHPRPGDASAREHAAAERGHRLRGGLPPSPSNPWADDLAAAELGRRLFFDRGLSANGEIACATCHQPARWFSDGLPRAVGLAPGARHTQSLVGAAWFPFLGWDGRSDSVWARALGPLEDPREHGSTRAEVAAHIARAHRAEWEVVFGPLPPLPARIPARPVPRAPSHPHHQAWARLSEAERGAVEEVFVRAGKALEAYVRRLEPQPSAFDRYVASLDAGESEAPRSLVSAKPAPPDDGRAAPRSSPARSELSPAALRGLRAFIGEAGCIACHHGPRFSDGEFHNLGLPAEIGASDRDPGRAAGLAELLESPFSQCGPHGDEAGCRRLRFAAKGLPEHAGALRTPSLRNVAETAPYMHHGGLASLERVVEHYRRLRDPPGAGARSAVLSRVPRSVATGDMVAFLRSLSGPLPEARWLEPPDLAAASGMAAWCSIPVGGEETDRGAVDPRERVSPGGRPGLPGD